MGNEANKSNTRRFTWGNPVIWNGNLYPTGIYPIMDDQGNTRNRTVFVDEGNQYHTINDEGREVPMALAYQLPEVTVTGHRPMKSAESHANDLLTLSNDMTQVNNLPHRRYNTNLDYLTQQGAKSNAAWREEHPNAAAWGDALGAVPFAVAAYPFVAGVGESLAETALGQAVRNGMGSLLTMPHVKTGVDVANVGIGSYFGGQGVKDISQGIFTPNTALDLLGLYGVYKYESNLLNTFKKNKYLSQKLQGREPLPFYDRKEGAKRYSDFIKSDEYANRLENAGLEDRRNRMIRLTNRQIGNMDYFPGSTATIIDEDPDIWGISFAPPVNEIAIKKGLSPNEFKSTLDHEIAHYATKNRGIDSKTPVGDMMRFNESIVPNIEWEDILSHYDMKTTPLDQISKDNEVYEYLIDPQEKRARAYSLYQQAKDEGLSTDAFVDKYTKDGKIVKDAPYQLRQMNFILTVDNIKKYLNKFLSVGIPLGLSTPYLNNNHYEHNR